MTTKRRNTRHSNHGKLTARLVIGLTAASLAVPAMAAGHTDAGGPASTNGVADIGAGAGGSGIVLHRDGSKAVPFNADTSPATAAPSSGGGFDWGDAMIGAGATAALVALIGAAGFTVRSRRRVTPAAPAQS